MFSLSLLRRPIYASSCLPLVVLSSLCFVYSNTWVELDGNLKFEAVEQHDDGDFALFRFHSYI